MTTDEGWTLDLIDDEFKLPGWLVVPPDLRADERDDWVRLVQQDVGGLAAWDGEQLSEEATREVLTAALELRAASDSLAILQIWPTMAHVTAMCHIDIVPSDALPDWSRTDLVVHRIEEPHLGPGLQISTGRTVSLDEVQMDVTSVTLAFDDGEVTLLFSLTETLTTLASLSVPGLMALMRNIRLIRTPDGAPFRSREPRGVLSADDWDLEETR